MTISITNEQARRLALACQGLDGGWRLPAGKEGAAQAIERLGFVQIDTIAVVERAHHHTFWVRRSGYQPAMLHELLAKDRRVFEYWAAPAAAYVPMCDYRWHLPRMRRQQGRWGTKWLESHRKLVEHVIDRIRAEGPLGSSDFAAPPGTKRGAWWDWKPAKMALETLYDRGQLMVSSRRNFERRYDLAERVLPQGLDRREPPDDEVQRFAVRRYLAAHGVAARGDMRWSGYQRMPESALRDLLASGEVVRVEIEGLADEPHFSLRETIDGWRSRRARRSVMHILSPFDSVLGNRNRVRRLFGFDYRIECYVPAARRKYGYFCLPLLWDGRFVGRMDSKADRPQRVLRVHSLHLEPGAHEDDALAPALADRLAGFARFNGCDRVEVTSTAPKAFRAPLLRALRQTEVA